MLLLRLLLLFVIVELHQLRYERSSNSIERCHLVRSDSNLNILHLPDNRLELLIFNSIHGLDDFQVIILRFILHNSLLDRRKVLLVREIDVVEERTLTGQERTSYFEGFCVPELRLLLLLNGVPGGVFFHLHDEPDLGGVTEVGDSKETELSNERLSCEFHFILSLFKQFLHSEWLQLHDAPY